MRINRTYALAGTAWLVLVVVGAVLVWAVISRAGESLVTQPGPPIGEAAPITSPPESERTDKPKSPEAVDEASVVFAVRLAGRAVRWSVRAGVTVEHAQLRSDGAAADLVRRRSWSWAWPRPGSGSHVFAEQPAAVLFPASAEADAGPGRTTDLAGERGRRHGGVPWGDDLAQGRPAQQRVVDRDRRARSRGSAGRIRQQRRRPSYPRAVGVCRRRSTVRRRPRGRLSPYPPGKCGRQASPGRPGTPASRRDRSSRHTRITVRWGSR